MTTAGVTVVDPRVRREHGAAPRARIESVIVHDRRLDIAQHAILPSCTRNLQIEDTTLGVAFPTKVGSGIDSRGPITDWRAGWCKAAGDLHEFGSRSIPVSRVATTTEGVWHQSDDVWEFSVRPVHYQTSWFYALCTTALCLFVWAAWQLRLRQVRHEFSVVLAERVRLSR